MAIRNFLLDCIEMGKLPSLIPDEWFSYCDIDKLEKIDREIDWKANIYPSKKQIFNSLNHTKPSSIKVVILGQDPYHGPHQAMGLSFSVPATEKIPPSLRNIFKEIEQSTGKTCLSGDLSSWAKQGVLLLNSILTVEAGKPESHKKTGWMEFTQNLVSQLSNTHANLVFMLWGAYAQKQESLLAQNKNHLFLKAPHPSPLSAHRGFLGCNHFNLANDFLINQGKKPINWSTLM